MTSCFQRVRAHALDLFERAKPGLFHVFLATSFVFSFLALGVALRSSPCWDSRGEVSLLEQNAGAISALAFPLKHAHSHNDYAQSKPLLAALMAGFCSLEADVFLRKDNLFVGHQFVTSTDHTQSLTQSYLLPLLELSRQNGNSSVYKQALRLQTCEQITLLVDIKSKNVWETYRRLELDLERMNENFTYFETSTRTRAPIRVVATGLKPEHLREIAAKRVTTTPRRTSLDLGTEEDMGEEVMKMAAWISHRWPYKKSQSVVHGELGQEMRDYVRARVEFAHRHGLLLRFWDTPEDPALWDALLRLGVDLINTDRIFTLRAFLAGLT